MSKLFSSLTIHESMGTLTGKRTFVEWLRLCNHSIILARKKEGLSKAYTDQWSPLSKKIQRTLHATFEKPAGT